MNTIDRHEALRRKGERRKKDILRVARRIFLEKGYGAASVQDILDALRLSKGGFYHHFDSKLSVLTGIAALHAQESLVEYQKSGDAPPLARLNALLRRAAFLRGEDAGLLRALNELENQSDGAIFRDALLRASASAFFADFSALCLALSRAGQAAYPGEDALLLSFEAFLHGGFFLLRCLGAGGSGLSRGASLLWALRRQAESALRLPPGSVEVVTAEDLGALARALAP